MLVLFVWILFLAGVGCNLCIRERWDVGRINFIGGDLLGQPYYIIPITFAFWRFGPSYVTGIWRMRINRYHRTARLFPVAKG